MDVNGVDPCGILRDRFAQGLGTYGKTLDSGGGAHLHPSIWAAIRHKTGNGLPNI